MYVHTHTHTHRHTHTHAFMHETRALCGALYTAGFIVIFPLVYSRSLNEPEVPVPERERER